MLTIKMSISAAIEPVIIPMEKEKGIHLPKKYAIEMTSNLILRFVEAHPLM
jgi:hypothetical protein